MVTRNIVPRADGEGELGTELKRWLKVHADNIDLNGTDIETALAAKTEKNVLTTKGDLYIRNATDITRLPVGSDGEILMADSGETAGVRWTPLPLYATTDASNVYERGSVPSIKGTSVAADRYTWVSPSGGLVVGINGAVYALTSQTELDLSNPAHWDTTSTDYTVAATRAGKDFYVYACEPTSGNTPVLLLSASSTYPAGYTADTSRKIGGFHCLCADVGTITGHPLTGFVAGDILPLSVWDLKHRPKSAPPEGMVWCEEANIWVDIYLQSGTGGTTASAYNATITDTRTWMDHVDDLAAVNKRLLDDGEFQKIAAGGNEETNIAGSADPGTTGGHIDTAGRRMISFIGCEDCAGVMYQWLSDQSYRSGGTTWSWKNLPGEKGNIHTQGTYGDVKLRAGGLWADGAHCGSRCRYATYSRGNADSNSGARGAAEPV
jgi:hypothetical protein